MERADYDEIAGQLRGLLIRLDDQPLTADERADMLALIDPMQMTDRA